MATVHQSRRAMLLLESLEDRQLLSGTPAPFASADELKQWLVDQASARYAELFGKTFDAWGPGIPWMSMPGEDSVARDPLTAVLAATASYTGTNLQTEGIDESDFVKTDGRFIYDASRGVLSLVEAGPDFGLRSQTHYDGEALGLFVHGSRLTLITQQSLPDLLPLIASREFSGLLPAFQPRIEVTTYSISDSSELEVVDRSLVDGFYSDARANDDSVAIVVQNLFAGLPMPAYTFFDGKLTYETSEAYFTRIQGSELGLALPNAYAPTDDPENPLISQGWIVEPTSLYRPLNEDDLSLTSVITFDPWRSTPGPSDSIGLIGSFTNQVYASTDHLYIMSASQSGAWEGSSRPIEETFVQQIVWTGTDLDYSAVGKVPGRLLNQFAADEADGVLRVATTQGWGPGASNGVYILEQAGDELAIVGSVDGIAPGETLYAARFDGDFAYLVTFQQVDPLFVIDVSVPTHPTVLGELIAPGFARYLQKIDDAHLLALRREGSVIQVTLYDVSNPLAPAEVDTYRFNEIAGLGRQAFVQTEAEWDHHAFTYLAESGLLALPVYSWDGGPASGLIVLEVDARFGIDPVATIVHDSAVRRSFQIGTMLYSVAEDSIQAHQLDDLGAPGREVRLFDDPRYVQAPPIATVVGREIAEPLATFEVDDPTNLNARIQWGDGSESAGDLTRQPNGRYAVRALHAYQSPGSYMASIAFERDGEAVGYHSTEIVAANSPSPGEKYVRQLYRELLGRDADGGGLAYWSGELGRGVRREAVVLGFQASTEYRTNEIHHLYQDLLGRNADPSGLQTWLGTLTQGHGIGLIAASIMGSQEYFERSGGTESTFVRSLYRAVLGRESDQAGLADWIRSLRNGKSRGQLALAFIGSEEGKTSQVREVYQQHLGRSADETGVRIFSAALSQGKPREYVVAQVLASDEYFGRFV